MPAAHGFGTTLIERSLEASGGEAAIRYGADGVSCAIRLPLSDEGLERMGVPAASPNGPDERNAVSPVSSSALRGKRILLVEDEPLVAMEIESELSSAGCHIVGPAGTVGHAMQLIAEGACDAALVDANLGGCSANEVAAALTQKGIPFAFATGYGREALPGGFQEAPILSKPFGSAQLLATVAALLGDTAGAAVVIPLRPKKT